MQKTLALINGAAENGKDTFIDYVQRQLHERSEALVFNESSIDPVKKAMQTFLGWDGESKEDHDRACMAAIKAAWDKYYQGTVNHCMHRTSNVFHFTQGSLLLFYHVREPANIEDILREFKGRFGTINDFNVITVLVHGKERVTKYNNDADRNVEAFEYDLLIDNDGTPDELRAKALGFATMWQAGTWANLHR